ncbi:DNA modification methylase [bacterium]|nr:DNA modification methylase [bacterium]
MLRAQHLGRSPAFCGVAPETRSGLAVVAQEIPTWPITGGGLLEDPRYLTEQIVTYIGNKRALLPFIERGLLRVKAALRRERLRVVDPFAGSGIVARYLKQHASLLVTNDLEQYSAVLNRCFLRNRSTVSEEGLAERLALLEQRVADDLSPGLITELYAPRDEEQIEHDDRVFYTRRNAIYLDAARRAIGALETEWQPLFLGPLLAAASVHANTSGVFKGFYKNREGRGQFGGAGRHALNRICGEIRLRAPILSRFECEVEVLRGDANRVVDELPKMDLAYIDPPYNQHPYGSNYFMLNLLAKYRRPEQVSRVSGVPTDWNRSAYNRRRDAEAALFDLLARIRTRFLLVSYNSEGFISRERFLARLDEIGEVETLETPYNAFRGSRNLRGRPLHVTEYLFLVRKR